MEKSLLNLIEQVLELIQAPAPSYQANELLVRGNIGFQIPQFLTQIHAFFTGRTSRVSRIGTMESKIGLV
jgi:hypothetical protein